MDLNVTTAFVEELCKTATAAAEARESLSRLKALEANKPTADAVARGAITGAVVGPAATLVGRGVSGDLQQGVRKGLTQAMKAPTKGGKALGVARAGFQGVRGLAGSAASGAVFGAGLPAVRRHLDQEAEKEKLRDYLNVSRRGRLRSSVAQTLGVG
jgi:hypothetical protein